MCCLLTVIKKNKKGLNCWKGYIKGEKGSGDKHLPGRGQWVIKKTHGLN